MGRHRQKNKQTANMTAADFEERRIVGVDDMVLLGSVTDSAVLANLKQRHAADMIYTFIGHVLVVVNPYKWLPIYTPEVMAGYSFKSRIDVVPHVFATAEETYRTMMNEEDNQCVIISGESGAGKTEASKQIQNYIAQVSGSGDGVDKVKRTFLESNPLLEAFGNAKTLRNNNSSRFGKYFELFFDSAGSPQGGKVTNYLLEKSRVVAPGKGERNFHIFYQLLAGLPESVRAKWHLDGMQMQNFQFLATSGCFDVDDVNDQQEFEETMQAMKHVGIKKKQQELVLQLVAAILHLGNVSFTAKQVGDAEGSKVSKSPSLAYFCELAGVDLDKLEHSLCFKLFQTMAPGGKMESYEVPQNPSQAQAQRNSIAKDLYEKMFDFLVERINSALDIDKKAQKTGQDLSNLASIGILDIYGFEIFDKNGFEQFCINYVNEKLQQIFIELTLKSEQEEYEREGITWTPIPFFNNKVVVDLIEAKKPTPGLFLILDDTVKTMHSRQGANIDGSFLDKAVGFHKAHAHFKKRGKVFEIQHYAGEVSYSVDGFGDATRDALSKDIQMLLHSSNNKLLAYMYPDEIDLSDRRLPKTAGFKIRNQCAALVTSLMACTPHYVRCMKSNDSKQPNRIDEQRLVHQAKYLGILENIKVRRAGYAYRGEYGRFVDRFKILSSETYPEFRGSDKKGTKAILREATKSLSQLEKECQFGKSMLFIRTPETYFALEKLREAKIGSFAAKIQKKWRKYAGQKEVLDLKSQMNKLYQHNNKERQRVSIYRPFDKDYILQEEVRQACLTILRFYGDEEKIVFFDDRVQKAVKINSSGKNSNGTSGENSFSLRDRIMLFTEEYFYLFEKRTWPAPVLKNKNSTWQPPLVYLRRRVAIIEIVALTMTQFADPFITFHLQKKPSLTEEDKSHWLPNNQAMSCMATGKPFGLFNRRHHCRFSGKIYANAVCSQLEVVPDRGCFTPVRVYDGHIGFISTDPLEDDQLLSCEKKTEVVAMLLMKNKIPVHFSNSIRLQCHVSCSQSPNQEIVFQCREGQRSIKIEGNNIIVATGVPKEYVKQRRKREKERQKKIERKREAEAALRNARREKREQKREEDRLKRVAEKKARKREEREAKEAAQQDRMNSSKSIREGARQFGETSSRQPASLGGNSELAAILARRRGGG